MFQDEVIFKCSCIAVCSSNWQGWQAHFVSRYVAIVDVGSNPPIVSKKLITQHKLNKQNAINLQPNGNSQNG